jgi:ELWxxDGT repeat protein
MNAIRVLTRHTSQTLMTLTAVFALVNGPLFGQLTTRVKDINTSQSAASSDPSELVAIGNVVYFNANNGKDSYELWRSDGTAAGTRLVRDGDGSSQVGSNPMGLTKSNGMLFFNFTGTWGERELWKSDGTAAGTIQLKNLASGQSWPSSFFDLNGIVYFTATDATGTELWKTDGSEAGTVRVKDIFPGPSSSSASFFTNVNGMLFFRACDAAGCELWKSDGSEVGTVRVKDINPGAASSFPSALTNVNGTLFFARCSSSQPISQPALSYGRATARRRVRFAS